MNLVHHSSITWMRHEHRKVRMTWLITWITLDISWILSFMCFLWDLDLRLVWWWWQYIRAGLIGHLSMRRYTNLLWYYCSRHSSKCICLSSILLRYHHHYDPKGNNLVRLHHSRLTKLLVIILVCSRTKLSSGCSCWDSIAVYQKWVVFCTLPLAFL